MKEERQRTIGCIFSLARLVVVMPLWMWIIYTVLSSVAAPTYVFILFAVYIVSVYVLAILEALVQVAND